MEKAHENLFESCFAQISWPIQADGVSRTLGMARLGLHMGPLARPWLLISTDSGHHDG